MWQRPQTFTTPMARMKVHFYDMRDTLLIHMHRIAPQCKEDEFFLPQPKNDAGTSRTLNPLQ